MNSPHDHAEEMLDSMLADGAGVRTDWSDHDRPLVAVAEAVGAFQNERPSDLPPLGTEVDGDALRRLFRRGDGTAETAVTFAYQELEITITRTEILVSDPAAE